MIGSMLSKPRSSKEMVKHMLGGKRRKRKKKKKKRS